jgi:hypothetical protein
MTRERRSVKQWTTGCLLVSLAILSACSPAIDDTGDDYQPTGTVPVRLVGDGLEWSPAQSLDDETRGELIAALERLGFVMIVPASPPPGGEAASAEFDAYGEGYPNGVIFAGTAHAYLSVDTSAGSLVVVSTPDYGCAGESVTLAFRGDPAACASTGALAEVAWEESGQGLRASFGAGLALEEGLAWLETWQLVP